MPIKNVSENDDAKVFLEADYPDALVTWLQIEIDEHASIQSQWHAQIYTNVFLDICLTFPREEKNHK